MKFTILLLSALILNPVIKESSIHGTYSITKTVVDATCTKKEAFLELTFKCPEGTCAKHKIWFKKNGGKSNFVKISARGTFTQKLSAGNYELEFSASDCYSIKTSKIKIDGQTRVSMTVEFEKNDPMMIEEKPVIYLYPEATTSVNVQLQNQGEMTFTYPNYTTTARPDDSVGRGWNVIANPDGTLETNGNKYNYLFWDGKIEPAKIKTNYSEGFIIGSDSLVKFLENSLTTAGLNTKESADFITYWAPRMMQNEKNYIHFMFTNEYDKIASINITPKPDNILRLYMIWSDVSNDKKINVTPQAIPTFNRKGFSVIEWGGSELQNIQQHL